MELGYPNKRSAKAILSQTPEAFLEQVSVIGNGGGNRLIRGDNLRVMKSLLTNYTIGA